MIRRFYVMPLDRGVGRDAVDAFVAALTDADRFIAGLVRSSAAVDLDGRAVVWEMLFADEATYSGPYMVHPYHMATLDTYLIGDSPECITHDIFTARYDMPADAPPPMDRGIRRLILLNLPAGADTALLQAMAGEGEGVAHSLFSADNVAFLFPGKTLAWTHVWEQGFADEAALERYLATPHGRVSGTREGLRRLGADVTALSVLAYPFRIAPAPAPAALPEDDGPVFYTITARTAPDDADAYLAALERDYDPVLAGVDVPLVHRWRSVEQGYGETEVHSTWRLASVAAFSPLRILTMTDPSWNRFVATAMPLVTGGTRRFYRAV